MIIIMKQYNHVQLIFIKWEFLISHDRVHE